jgi:cytochrome c peroxidase
MQGPKLNDDQVAALAAYLHTFAPPPSAERLRGTANSEHVERGRALFEQLECAACHASSTYTTAETYDVGLHDKEGNTHFNPPSLRGVGQRDPLFHDASAATLEEVFTKHGHQLDGRKLSDGELRDLTAFLRSL